MAALSRSAMRPRLSGARNQCLGCLELFNSVTRSMRIGRAPLGRRWRLRVFQVRSRETCYCPLAEGVVRRAPMRTGAA